MHSVKTCQFRDSFWLPRPPACGAYRPWLVDEGSLTRRLQARSKNFAVQSVCQQWGCPLPDEAVLLGLKPGETALVREVSLQDGDTPLVFARSILPRSSLRGAWRGLGRLGAQPLGAALFSDRYVVRHPLAFRKLAPRDKELHCHAPGQWARRSLFERDGHRILVTEAFLPAVLER